DEQRSAAAEKADLGATVADGLDRLVDGEGAVEVEADLWVFGSEGRQQRGQRFDAGRGHRGNLDPTRTQPAQSSHMCLGGLEVADDEPGRTFELFARLTEGDSTSDAMEECDSEFVLEAFD